MHRIELAQDNKSFWQVPHIDTFEKRITIIVYISSEEEDLGTDLFSDDKTFVKRVEWMPNRCFILKLITANGMVLQKENLREIEEYF